jgi:hypothetical protein
MATPKYRLNESPRISANQLAEYTLATPSRRQTIIRNAKFAPTFLTIRYNEAREAVTDYLTDGTRPVAKLHTSAIALQARGKVAPTDFKKDDLLKSAEAVESFAHFIKDINKPPPKPFTGLLFKMPVGHMPKLMIGGTEVSVQLDLISINLAKDTCGGVVLQTSKGVSSKNWRLDHAANVATLVYMASEAHLSGYGAIDRANCFAVDLFGKSAIQAPTSYKTRSKDLAASCGEIAALWPPVLPPADYDGPPWD